MAFSNRVRLPFMLHKPQFLEDSDRYRKANGETVTLSVVVRKVYEGLTDRLPEKLHDRLKIALVHDRVQVEGDKYVGVVTQEGDYQIDWQDFLSHPLAQAKFKAEVTPFNATNSNCGTCEEMIQVVANDDNAGELEEDATYTIDVLANDNICCNPVSIALVTFDSNYLTSAVVNGDNEIVIHTKTPLPAITGVTILSYRAQCQNGQFDDANVIADLDGSLPACNAPTDLVATDITATTATIEFTPASGAVGYQWELWRLFVNTLIASGTVGAVDHVDVSGMIGLSDYRFYIKTDCGSGNLSNFVYIDFTTGSEPPGEFCGQYHLQNQNLGFKNISYIDCSGNTQNFILGGFQETDICALQYSPGVPVSIEGVATVTVTYTGLC